MKLSIICSCVGILQNFPEREVSFYLGPGGGVFVFCEWLHPKKGNRRERTGKIWGDENDYNSITFGWFGIAVFDPDRMNSWVYIRIAQRVHKHGKFKETWFSNPNFSVDPFLKLLCQRRLLWSFSIITALSYSHKKSQISYSSNILIHLITLL